MDAVMLLGLSVRIFQSSGLRSTPFVSVDLTIPDHKGIEVGRKVFLEMLGPAFSLLRSITLVEGVALLNSDSYNLLKC